MGHETRGVRKAVVLIYVRSKEVKHRPDIQSGGLSHRGGPRWWEKGRPQQVCVQKRTEL